MKIPRYSGHLLLFLLCGWQSAAFPAPAYVGSAECGTCHENAWEAWRGSHHYQAMLPASEDTVLGDFSGSNFEYYGVSSRFYRRDGKFLVETDNERGELQEFEIAYTFGFHPLQQYLVPFPDGRLQALNIVWDSRRESEGGQRWVHLYPDERVTHEDIVHWTGSFQNWNSRCATCHSTGLVKNYSATADRYQTTWQEINVACEACHGPASAHLEWTAGDRQSKDRGFTFSLDDRGTFGPAGEENARTHTRQDGLRPTQQIETCAVCHSRRSQFREDHAGGRFDDSYRLALIEPGLYFPDGQIEDEVYVYGSFLQSRMHGAGVVCTDCHEPHSNKVLAEGNALCTRCHTPAFYDRPSHHHHGEGSPGAACINCHMPFRTYMVVDDRRDHSFRVPDPALTLELGVPNGCTQCHADRDAAWANGALAGWGISGRRAGAEPARALASGWSGQTTSLPALLALAARTSAPSIMRSSAILATQDYPSQETLTAVQQLLNSEDSLLRAAAARSLDWLPAGQRYALLWNNIDDPSRAVRLAVARQLSEIPVDRLPVEEAARLKALRREYLEAMLFNADMPEGQLNLGLYHAGIGDLPAAEKAYRTALKLSPAFIPAMLNLADLYRANDMDEQAEPLLRQAVEIAPGQADTQHAMGLLKVRQGKLNEALPHLEAAAKSGRYNSRFGYVYAVALWESGERMRAVTVLEALLERIPGNREITNALASYYQQLGQDDKLRQLMQETAPEG